MRAADEVAACSEIELVTSCDDCDESGHGSAATLRHLQLPAGSQCLQRLPPQASEGYHLRI